MEGFFIMKYFASLAILLTAAPAYTAESSAPFVAVFVDARTERSRLGAFPYDRSVYAQAIRKVEAAGGRAVVLKYFLDQSKPGKGDAELAQAMGRMPTLLQMSAAMDEAAPNAFDERFYALGISSDAAAAVEGSQGWLPLAEFSQVSAGVGSVDLREAARPDRVPLLARYQGRLVKSLWLLALEQALGAKARIDAGRSVTMHEKAVPVTPRNEVEVTMPIDEPLDALSLIDLLDGRIKRTRLQGKVVVLGYIGSKAETFQFKGRTFSTHELFYLELLGLYRRLAL